MIAFLRGHGHALDVDRLLVIAHDVGYEVRAVHTHLTAGELDMQLAAGLFIWHVIRQDDQELFGFWNLVDRQLAKLIAETDGIGPTGASRLVQAAGCQAVLTAVVQQDAKLLAKLCKGLGPKRADKIIHQLKDYAEEQMQTMPGMVRIPGHRKTTIARGLESIGFTVQDGVLSKLLEDNLEREDGQIIRLYINQVAVRT